MLWHLTSKFCVLSCKLVLAWEPWGNAGGTATGSPSWVRCPIRGKDFFLSVAGFFHYYIFIVLMLIFFLPFIPFKENCIYTKWVPFCENLLKQRLIDRAIVKDGTPTRASVLFHQEPPTWEWFPSGVLTAFGLWRSNWETYIYFFGQIDLF